MSRSAVIGYRVDRFYAAIVFGKGENRRYCPMTIRGLQKMLTTVAAFRESWEAYMFCSRLEAEGVPAFVIHEFHIGVAWHYSTALGGVKVQVHEERTEDARSIERRCRGGEFLSLLESEFGSLDNIHCPNCGSHDYWKRRPFLAATISILVLFLLGAVFPPTRWVCFCNICGTKFRLPLYRGTSGNWAMIMMVAACGGVVLGGLGLAIWALGTEHRFAVVLVAALLAGPPIARWLSRLGNEQD